MSVVEFKTFGCRLNQYDSEWLREEFEAAGFESSSNDKAHICVINTCAVTQKACREARNEIRKRIKKSPKPFIIVTGCYPKISPHEVSQIKGIDLIEPSPQKIVKEFLKIPLTEGIKSFFGRDKAFVKIQEGCDEFCSYCVVPYVRGKPYERPIHEIIQEVYRLIQNGYEEFILTGTNLGKCKNLLQIVEKIEPISGVKRIGFGSIEPLGITDKLIEFIQSSNKFSKYFHIPLQSGDNKILRAMKRWYTREEYIELICKIKTKIPDCAIGADVIVGFPGEGGKEFLNTYELIKSSPISRLHIFRYSKRPNTYALSLPDEPPPMIKKERSLILQKLSAQKWEDFRKQFVDKIFDSHVEKETKEGWSVGVTKNYIKIFFKPKKRGAIKKFVNLRIKRIEGPFTYGEIVDENNCSP